MLNLQHFGYVTLFDDDRTVPENAKTYGRRNSKPFEFQVEFFITTEKYPYNEGPISAAWNISVICTFFDVERIYQSSHNAVNVNGRAQMDTQDIIALIAVYLIIAAALVLSQTAQKKGWNWDYRKIVHIGVGAFIYVWWAFSANWIMLVFFAIPFEIVLFFAMFPGNPISDSKLGELSNEMGHRGGLFLYVLTIILLVAFFFDHWIAATIAIVAMTRGDGFGSIIGKKYGKHKIINGKSAEGSIGVFAATFLISLVIIGFYGWLASQGMISLDRAPYIGAAAAIGYAALSGVLASVIEAVTPGDFDNIAIPMIIAIVLVCLGL